MASLRQRGGLLLGSTEHVVLPTSLFNASAAPLLLFQTRDIAAASLTVGAPSDSSLKLRLTSPVINSSLTLSGGFWDTGLRTRRVFWQKITDVAGTQVSLNQAALRFGGAAVLGAQRYVFDRAAEASHLATGFEVAFTKL